MISKTRLTRKKRIRGRVSGTDARPRLSVYRSLTTVYAQVINDEKGVTLAEAHGKKGAEVGEELAKKAVKAKVKKVVFDRSGYRYHGHVKALAEAARNGGLEF